MVMHKNTRAPILITFLTGLDASKYQRITLGEGSGVSFDQQVYTLESQMTDEERFRDVAKWSPKCGICRFSTTFPGIVHSMVRFL